MQIDGPGSLYNPANLVTSSNPGTTANTAGGAVYDPGRVILGDTFARALDVGESLATLDQLITAAQPTRARPALAASAGPLNLGTAALTATTLRSGEEVNATPTSFSPFGPAYELPTTSTAAPTLDGIYDGTNGTQTLEFRSRRNGTHVDGNGGSTVRFRIFDESGSRLRDPDGNRYADIVIRRQDDINQEYAVGNGLILTLGEGFVANGDSFFVDVYADVGSVVDSDKAFDGVHDFNPNLQYGLSVTGGSFDINGINIAVNAGDSINDVLGRINTSSAGVTAVFDAATEQILLTQDTKGSAYDITLANDTSGFLQATKLDNPVREPGTDGDSRSPINELPRFAAVVSGNFRVNDVDIALDVAVDSLDDILARIEASAANVSTSLIHDRVFVEARHRQDFMILEDGGTGLFDALHIREGRYKPRTRDGINLDSATAIASSVAQATAAIDRLLEARYPAASIPAGVAQLQARVRSVLGSAEGVLLEKSQPNFGLAFDLSSNSRTSLTLLDASELVQTLRVDFSTFKAAFIGETPDARAGFVRQLLDVVNGFTAALRRELGGEGFLAGLSV